VKERQTGREAGSLAGATVGVILQLAFDSQPNPSPSESNTALLQA